MSKTEFSNYYYTAFSERQLNFFKQLEFEHPYDITSTYHMAGENYQMTIRARTKEFLEYIKYQMDRHNKKEAELDKKRSDLKKLAESNGPSHPFPPGFDPNTGWCIGTNGLYRDPAGPDLPRFDSL